MGNKHSRSRARRPEKSADAQQTRKSLPTTKHTLLVQGYIRQNTKHSLAIEHAFPSSITQWIYHYFQSKSVLYWTSPQHIYSVSIEKDDTRERVNALMKMEQCYCPAVTYKRNIRIPLELPSKAIDIDSKYNVLFKCGGIANNRSLIQECTATILEPPSIYKTEEQLVSNLRLPQLPQRVASNCIVFSEQYGLLSIGGFVGTYNNWNSLPRRYISNVYRLDFSSKHTQIIERRRSSSSSSSSPSSPSSSTSVHHTQSNGSLLFDDSDEEDDGEEDGSSLTTAASSASSLSVRDGGPRSDMLRAHFEPEWSWQQLSNMQEARGYASAQIINTRSLSNRERLIVIGGDLETGNIYSNSCEMYNFERQKWQYLASMKHGRICSGIHYDADIGCIYVGGGYCDSRIEMYSNFKKVEIFNCHKNAWYPFPDTNLKHAFYPYLWKHNNLLFIASAYSTGLEFIDLRIGMTWNTVYGEKNQKKKKFWQVFMKDYPHTATSGAICSGRLVG
eukprot:CAMPEP_0197074870 /NCGR_PEP_ID=MMETSP1384-20130603/211324_1 /TAXON_ID=29189 /ORGANISM="Ammonia sp." /LENGTH=502 /DNA_ID=CAMNT_0042513711 /DNA_START=33 /DNA_END=1541 /DNA_ORIENTATION=-